MLAFTSLTTVKVEASARFTTGIYTDFRPLIRA